MELYNVFGFKNIKSCKNTFNVFSIDLFYKNQYMIFIIANICWDAKTFFINGLIQTFKSSLTKGLSYKEIRDKSEELGSLFKNWSVKLKIHLKICNIYFAKSKFSEIIV